MMDMRRISFTLFAAVFLLAGCRPAQSATSAPPDQPAPSAPMQTVARVHWLGMKRLSAETNAASLMTIWKLPESRKLEQQTLDKLSLAPWRLLHRNVDTNAAALLRPLLDDLVADESYLEIRQATNQPGELVLAIRLDDQRAALWQTNLARVLESLTGIPPVPAPDQHYGWSLKKHHAPNLIQMTRLSGWILVGAADDHNRLVAELKSRIQLGQAPFITGDTNDWFEADLDPSYLIPGLATLNSQLSTLNHFHLAVTGGGTNVLMNGTVNFPQPLALDLKPWNIPTNLIDEHVSSFTVIRGVQPWLASLKAWNGLQIGLPPDQACFWAQQGLQMQSYFTAPLADASNEVDRLTDWVLKNQQGWFVTNGLAKFERSTTFNGLEWRGLPYMSPFLRSIAFGRQNFIYGGGLPGVPASPLSLKTLQATLSRTNLVYHDWETTGPRVEQWIYMGQFARLTLHKSQLPPGSPGLLWLKAVAPKLGESVTDVTETEPDRLSFTRRSRIGLTGFELNLLADWLESPRFPIGLHTLLVPPTEFGFNQTPPDGSPVAAR